MVPGISEEALLADVAKRDQQVMDVHDSILAPQEDLQAVENILEHEDVQEGARATACQMATKEAAPKKGPPPPAKTAAPTVVAEKNVWKMLPLPPKQPLGHRHDTRALAQIHGVHVGQRREQVQPMERRISDSCGPLCGDEGMGA